MESVMQRCHFQGGGLCGRSRPQAHFVFMSHATAAYRAELKPGTRLAGSPFGKVPWLATWHVSVGAVCVGGRGMSGILPAHL